ncbi:hypothetical protein E2C01_051380 [Portunus trituberculatus]|uniref:Uncharacterized protein n=1 Tax=Portunus trituberculatus TaxID=210409 RepID=A0A5B7GBF7_PORTR|nr:hypothetical protein [Portunus trituberculatus]
MPHKEHSTHSALSDNPAHTSPAHPSPTRTGHRPKVYGDEDGRAGRHNTGYGGIWSRAITQRCIQNRGAADMNAMSHSN